MLKSRLDLRPNVPRADQAVRLLFSAVLLGLAGSGLTAPLWGGLLVLLGFFQAATALSRYCPVFDLLGRPPRDGR